MKKKTIKILISSILSILFLYYFLFKTINWDLFFKFFYTYNFLYIIPTLLLILTNIYFGTLRWRLILMPFKKIQKKIIFKAIMLSNFMDLVLPINLGDFFRAYIIRKEEKIKYSTIFGTILIDRVFSIFAILFMGVTLLLIMPIPTNLIDLSQKIKMGLKIIFLILLGLIFLVFILIKFQKTNFVKNRIKQRYLFILENFSKTIIHKRKFSEILQLIFYSLIIRSLYGLTTFTLVKGLGYDIPFYLFLFVDILITLVVSIGQHFLGIIGTYETTMTYILAIIGLSKEEGLFTAFLSDISYFFPVVVFGLYYFIKEDWSFKKLKNLKK